jgi:hypothetical protein
MVVFFPRITPNERGRTAMVSPMKIERIKQQVTQIDLWMKTGIPQWRISLIERGIIPKPEEAGKIAIALRASVGELFPDSNGNTALHERK